MVVAILFWLGHLRQPLRACPPSFQMSATYRSFFRALEDADDKISNDHIVRYIYIKLISSHYFLDRSIENVFFEAPFKGVYTREEEKGREGKTDR